MEKQTFHRIKNILAILLAVIFLASLTAASVGAVGSDFNVRKVSTTTDSDGNCVSYKIRVQAINDCPSGDCSYIWDFDGAGFVSKKPIDYHTFRDCNAHDITLTVQDNSDNSQSSSSINYSP